MSNKKSDWPRYPPTVFMDGRARGDKRGLELKSSRNVIKQFQCGAILAVRAIPSGFNAVLFQHHIRHQPFLLANAQTIAFTRISRIIRRS